MKKIISIVLSLMMIFSYNAVSLEMAFAGTSSNVTAGERGKSKSVTVYFTLSSDGEFVKGKDKDETLLAHIPVTLDYYDLAEYGLEDFYRYESDSFEAGGGYSSTNIVETPTVLHLFIKMLEKYYLDGEKLKVGGDALNITGSATHLYMKNFWGHDENLMYYVNHKYPLQAAGWGSTCDYILLEDGMEIDVAMFSDWDFYHTGAFAYFDAPGKEMNSSGQYEVNTNENITLKMLASGTRASEDGGSSNATPMPNENVVVCSQKDAVADNTNANWNLLDTTTGTDGTVKLSFDKPGVYYVSSDPSYENFSMESGNPCVAPPIAVVKVNGEEETPEVEPDYQGALIANTEFGESILTNSKKYEVKDNNIDIPDYKDKISAFVNLNENVPARTKVTATFKNAAGEEKINLRTDGKQGTSLSKLIENGMEGNTFTIEAICENENSDDVVETITYTINRIPTLKSLSLKDNQGNTVELNKPFSPEQLEYEAEVSKNLMPLKVDAIGFGEDYTVNITGENEEKINIEVESKQVKRIYTIDVTRKNTVSQNFVVTEGSIIRITDSNSGNLITSLKAESTKLTIEDLLENTEYSYKVTALGHIAKSGTFIGGRESTLDITLLKAPENGAINKNIPSTWSNFRGNSNNNAVTDKLLPTNYDNAQVYWAKKVGDGMGVGAPSSPILVNGNLVYTTATTIVKVNKTTGKVIKSGKMAKTSAFNITPPTYADGIIFVALGSGTIQAFNADTLESLWIYKNPHRGQPNSPITYHNGYIYTGFWSGDSIIGDYVCLSTTDEDPSNSLEEKTDTWTYTNRGGFYWAGSYACDDFVMVGGDDGTAEDNGLGHIFLFDPLTGEMLDSVDDISGDVRSTICRDSNTGKLYFTSKGGYFYQATVGADRKINIENKVDLGGASTSTPVISNGRAYVGVCGSGQFDVNGGGDSADAKKHNISVIDLSDMSIAYSQVTRGYPQTSGLVTTGYESTEGYTYVYFIENYEPGKIRVLKDKPGQKEAEIIRVSEYDDVSDNNALFTPKNDQANYAICSIISDENGTMYFKNDSGYMMALGSQIKNIRILNKPDKLDYTVGEVFDPKGMTVVADLKNGTRRDVTKYVTYSKSPLKVSDSDVVIEYKHISYNDTLGQGEYFDPLIATIDITVESATDKAKADELVKLIDAIPAVEKITTSDLSKIAAAVEYYQELDISAALIDKYVTNLQKLEDSKKKLAEIIAATNAFKAFEFTATSSNYNSVKLSWKKINYVDRYDIYRKSDAGEFKRVRKVEGAESYEDKSLICGKSYTYKIVPVVTDIDNNEVLEEGASKDTKSVVPTPQKGNLLSAVATSYSTVKLSWSKVEGADGYKVYRSTSSNGTYKPVYTAASDDSLTYVNKELKTGTTYFYKIKVYKMSGKTLVESTSFSNIKSAKPVLENTSISAITATDTKITLTWKKVSGASGYAIYRSKSKSGTYRLVKTIASGSTLSFTNTGMESAQNYYYKVRPVRVVNGKKVYSPAYSSYKSVKTKPSKVVVTSLVKKGKQVTLKWKAQSRVSGYEIYRKTGNGGFKKIATIKKPSAGAYTNKSLKKGTTYRYKVRSYYLVSGKKVYGTFSNIVSKKI